MSAAAVRAQRAGLERAEKALQALSLEARTAAVGRVLDAWADPGSELRARLLREHPPASGLGRANLAAGLTLALSRWSGEALARLVASEAPGAPPLAGPTAVVHGGVLPVPTLLDALAPLVLGSPVLCKPAARDPVTPRLVAESVFALAPELGDAVAVADVRRGDEAALDALLDVPRVVVTGSDEAVAAVATRIAKRGAETKLVAHGHKCSVAALGAGADLGEAAARLAVDVSLWDQLGCLSPIACWALGGAARARDFAAALDRALAAREAETPRGEVAPDAAARIASERSEAELRAAAHGDVVLHAGAAWTVVAEADFTLRPAPLHRFVRVHPVAGEAELRAALAPLAGRVAGLAHAGLAAPERLANALGATRTAPFGEIQAPPLDWDRDGLGVLHSLL